MTDFTESEILQSCLVCGVRIMNDGNVMFSSGNVGTRAQLYARVCRYAQAKGCINQDKVRIGSIMQEDGFPSEQNTQNSFMATNFKVNWKLFQT